MVDRYSSECTELCHFPNNNGDWVKYADYRALQAKLAAMVVAMNEAIDGAIPEGCYLCINKLKAAIAAAEGEGL